MLATIIAAPASAEPHLYICAQSHSPDGRHVAMVTWRGGSQVELVLCDFNCGPVRTYDRSAIRFYRWEAPGVIVVFDTLTRTRRPLATFRGIRAFAAPAASAHGRDLQSVRIQSRRCFLPEGITIEPDPQP